MIKIIVEAKEHDPNPKKEFNCPYCKKYDYFWAKISDRCSNCGRVLPPVHDFMAKPETLIEWHIKGIIGKEISL